MFQSPFCARQNGISLHCARRIKARERRELEALISYATRPPLSEHRLKQRDDGLLEFTLKRTFSDGTRALVLTPLALLGRLAAILVVATTGLHCLSCLSEGILVGYAIDFLYLHDPRH